jgi:hypothetical protein
MMTDKIIPLPVNMPEGVPEIGNLGFTDIQAAFNMRSWLEDCMRAKGAKITGGGFGGGVADVSIDLDGCPFWVTIKAM